MKRYQSVFREAIISDKNLDKVAKDIIKYYKITNDPNKVKKIPYYVEDTFIAEGYHEDQTNEVISRIKKLLKIA